LNVAPESFSTLSEIYPRVAWAIWLDGKCVLPCQKQHKWWSGMILMCMTSSQGSNTGTHHVGFSRFLGLEQIKHLSFRGI
jgi:hypothetical protein